MKKWLPLFLLFLTPAMAKAPTSPLRIAIVDTGLNLNDPRFKDHLCYTGHKDFTETGLEDTDGHGTFVAGLITKYAMEGNYCLLIYKYYEDKTPGYITLQREVKAFEEAVKNGAKIVNFSAGGEEFDEDEYLAVNDHPDVTFVVAAGNESKNIDTEEGHFYPASYHTVNTVIVGNVLETGSVAPYSNWSNKKMFWEVGDVNSTLPNNKEGRMRGTSFSAAVKTGKLIRERLNATK
jgi:subtilisin family serine protease